MAWYLFGPSNLVGCINGPNFIKTKYLYVMPCYLYNVPEIFGKVNKSAFVSTGYKI